MLVLADIEVGADDNVNVDALEETISGIVKKIEREITVKMTMNYTAECVEGAANNLWTDLSLQQFIEHEREELDPNSVQ